MTRISHNVDLTLIADVAVDVAGVVEAQAQDLLVEEQVLLAEEVRLDRARGLNRSHRSMWKRLNRLWPRPRRAAIARSTTQIRIRRIRMWTRRSMRYHRNDQLAWPPRLRQKLKTRIRWMLRAPQRNQGLC